MTTEVPGIPWVPPLLMGLLLVGGIALRRWGKGAAPATGMALLWLAVVIAIAWFAWRLKVALDLIQPA